MNQSIRALVDWEQPFPPEEYVARRRQVRAAMARDGIDGLLVTGAADVNYLTGYDQIWHSYLNLIGPFLRAEEEAALFFDNDGHIVLHSTMPTADEVEVLPRGAAVSHVPLIADAIQKRGWAEGRIALQPWCYGPHPTLLEAIGEHLAAAGAEVADGSTLVEDVRLTARGGGHARGGPGRRPGHGGGARRPRARPARDRRGRGPYRRLDG